MNMQRDGKAITVDDYLNNGSNVTRLQVAWREESAPKRRSWRPLFLVVSILGLVGLMMKWVRG